jgi:coenzyme F420-reducing hydrogenase beta subunit
MSKVSRLEEQVHGRQRRIDDEDELRFGVMEEMLYARATPPVQGAQWTGIVSQIAISMLESGAVDAVVCVQSDENDRRALTHACVFYCKETEECSSVCSPSTACPCATYQHAFVSV